LIFIIGTSLQVRPFSYLIKLFKEDSTIIIINKENLLENENFINEIKKIYLKEYSKEDITKQNDINNRINLLSLVGDSDLIVDYIEEKIKI
jgi:NAD-dependent SIR2 family protein deacetylase